MRKKVGQAFAVIVAITVIDSVVGYYFIQDMHEIVIILDKEARESIHLQEIKASFLEKSIILDEYIQSSDSGELVKLGHLENNIARNIGIATTLATELGEDETLQTLSQLSLLMDEINDLSTSLITLVENSEETQAHDLLIFELESKVEEVKDLLNDAVTLEESQLLNQLELAKETSNQSTISFIIIAVLSVVITVMLWSVITKDV